MGEGLVAVIFSAATALVGVIATISLPSSGMCITFFPIGGFLAGRVASVSRPATTRISGVGVGGSASCSSRSCGGDRIDVVATSADLRSAYGRVNASNSRYGRERPAATGTLVYVSRRPSFAGLGGPSKTLPNRRSYQICFRTVCQTACGGGLGTCNGGATSMAPCEGSPLITGLSHGKGAVLRLSTISVGRDGGLGASIRPSGGQDRKASKVERSGLPMVNGVVTGSGRSRSVVMGIGQVFTNANCVSGRAAMASTMGPLCKVQSFLAGLTSICPSAVVTYVDID